MFKNIISIVQIIIPLAYVAIGLTLMYDTKGVSSFIPPQYAPILGAAAILYGLFRGYRVYATRKEKQNG